VRDIEDDELGDTLRVQQGGAPADGSAPIVSRKEDSVLAELIGDGDDVGDQFRQGVGCHAGGLATEVVTALVRDDGAKAGSSQRLDLLAPSIPEFREAVKQNDNGAVARAGSDRVQADIAILK
jgi:hypothetical protein